MTIVDNPTSWWDPMETTSLSTPRKYYGGADAISARHREILSSVADTLILPADGSVPSALPEFDKWLDRAIQARGEQLPELTAELEFFADVAPGDLWNVLRQRSTDNPAAFHLLSSVVAGAYLMLPSVKERIGYPGQGGARPRFDEAVEQLEDGILDVVIERGPTFVPAAGE